MVVLASTMSAAEIMVRPPAPPAGVTGLAVLLMALGFLCPRRQPMAALSSVGPIAGAVHSQGWDAGLRSRIGRNCDSHHILGRAPCPGALRSAERRVGQQR